MNIYVLNEQFQKTSIIDVYESFIWTDRYYESGDFELVVPASIEMVSILQKDLYLSIDINIQLELEKTIFNNR